MIRTLIALCLALLLTGCAMFRGNAVRQLGKKEKEAFQALKDRLDENETFMRGAAENLGELGAEYAEKGFVLELALAKAKLLESMQAPWASPRDEIAATQRNVVLYHLYNVEMAEQKVLEARMQQRRASAQEVLEAYTKLSALLKEASKNLEIVLEYLNQPKSARIRAFTATFLSEVTAFREKLQESKNPRLQKLAEDVARYEEQASKAKEQAEKALDAILKVKGE